MLGGPYRFFIGSGGIASTPRPSPLSYHKVRPDMNPKIRPAFPPEYKEHEGVVYNLVLLSLKRFFSPGSGGFRYYSRTIPILARR